MVSILAFHAGYPGSSPGMGKIRKALIAQLGERQTEDLKAPCSIHGQSSTLFLPLLLPPFNQREKERER